MRREEWEALDRSEIVRERWKEIRRRGLNPNGSEALAFMAGAQWASEFISDFVRSEGAPE